MIEGGPIDGVVAEVDFILEDEFRESSPSELAASFAEARAFDGSEEERRRIVTELRLRARAGVRFWSQRVEVEGVEAVEPKVVRPARRATPAAAKGLVAKRDPVAGPPRAPDLFDTPAPATSH